MTIALLEASDIVRVMDISCKNKKLFSFFEQSVTPARIEKIKKIIQQRTRFITVVVEDVFQTHNASAIMRSCEAFGVQDIHCVVDKNATFENKNIISVGAAQWLSLYQYRKSATMQQPMAACVSELKKRGYTIIATSPHATKTLETITFDKPIALMLGTEDTGLSDEALTLADDTIAINMFGFTESFNVSVCAALCLYELTKRLRSSNIPWNLSGKEKEDLYLQWLKKSIDRVEQKERGFLQRLEEEKNEHE